MFTGDLWNPPFFYPEKNVLAYSDHLIGLGILFLPLRILSDSPGLLANTILFLAFLLTGLTTYLWLKDLLADDWASAAGAIGFSFAGWRMIQLSHPQLLFIPFLPLFLLIYRRTDSDRTSYWLLWSASALLALQTLCTPSLAIYFIPLVAMWTLLRGLLSRRAGFEHWGKQALLFSLPIGVNLPLAFRYWGTAEGTSFSRSVAEVRSFSAQWIDWISAPRAHWLYSDVLDFTHGMERELFPGFIPAAVLVTGGVSLLFCAGSQKRNFSGFLLVALIALWASGGPSEKGGFTLLRLPYDLIYNLVPGGDQVRVPARFVLLAGLFLAPVYTLGWARIFQVIRGRWGNGRRAGAACVCLVAVALLESLPGVAFYETVSRSAATEMALSSKNIEVKGAIFLPIPPVKRAYEEIDRMWLARRNGFPLFNGYSGHFPRVYVNLAELQEQPVSANTRRDLYAFLLHQGIDTIILDSPEHKLVDASLLTPVTPHIYRIPRQHFSLRRIDHVIPGQGIGLLLPRTGWSYPEHGEPLSSWIWSVSADARLRVPIDPTVHRTMGLRVRSLYAGAAASLEVLINGISLGSRVAPQFDSFVFYPLPENLTRPTWYDVEFRGPPPLQPSPNQDGSRDSRRLSICLYEIRFE